MKIYLVQWFGFPSIIEVDACFIFLNKVFFKADKYSIYPFRIENKKGSRHCYFRTWEEGIKLYNDIVFTFNKNIDSNSTVIYNRWKQYFNKQNNL